MIKYYCRELSQSTVILMIRMIPLVYQRVKREKDHVNLYCLWRAWGIYYIIPCVVLAASFDQPNGDTYNNFTFVPLYISSTYIYMCGENAIRPLKLPSAAESGERTASTASRPERPCFDDFSVKKFVQFLSSATFAFKALDSHHAGTELVRQPRFEHGLPCPPHVAVTAELGLGLARNSPQVARQRCC